jgi:hypothetical protein
MIAPIFLYVLAVVERAGVSLFADAQVLPQHSHHGRWHRPVVLNGDCPGVFIGFVPIFIPKYQPVQFLLKRSCSQALMEFRVVVTGVLEV